MARFVYSDISSTFETSTGGTVKTVHDIECIKQSIKNIFSTVSGERVRSPIGSSLIRHLFEPMNQITVRRIRDEISRAIRTYEPRVELINTQVLPDFDGNFYNISLEYVVSGVNRKDVFTTRLRRLSGD